MFYEGTYSERKQVKLFSRNPFWCVVRFSFIIVNSSKFRPLRWVFLFSPSPSLPPLCCCSSSRFAYIVFRDIAVYVFNKIQRTRCAERFRRRNEVKKDADKCIENLFLLFTFTTKKRHCVALLAVGERKICISIKLKESRWRWREREKETKNVFLIVVHQWQNLPLIDAYCPRTTI